MIEKSFLAGFIVLLLLASISADMQFEVVEANPYWILKTIDSIPGASL